MTASRLRSRGSASGGSFSGWWPSINSGEPIVGVYDQGKRYGVELPLRDAANKTIGALSVGFRYKSGDDAKAFLSKAEQLRAELKTQIPSLDNLVELDP